MVAISEIRSANAALKKTHDSLAAVFVGATSGIGLATLQSFADHIPKPKAIIVGRSRSKFQPELEILQELNPNGEFIFLETDISLIKNIDAVGKEIEKLLPSGGLDLLFTSQGYISFIGWENNADGLDNSISLRYYGRVRFTQNLLPLMSRNSRAISILAGGKEGKIFEDDLDLERNYSVMNSGNHFATMMTLSYDKLAESNPEKAFVHVYPGLVSTGLLGRSATGLLGLLFRFVLEPILSLFAITPEEAGERMLYYGTSEQYAKGSWSLDWDGAAKDVEVLREYRETGMGERIVEHNHKVFERATAVQE